MANDTRPRQQQGERAQTSGGSAQQGEWQPSPRPATSPPSDAQESHGQSASRDLARRTESTAYPTFGPFSIMRRFGEDIDRMFANFGMGPSFFPTNLWQSGREAMMAAWTPRIEMTERDDGKLVISADLPGVKKEDLNVQVTEDAVTIEGERRQERTREERGLYQSERSYGSFYRAIPLPEGVEPESASAEFKDGVLQIEISAPERKSRTHRLEIKG
jgi:HSP20 family protein